jgi:copper chaperone CopZ
MKTIYLESNLHCGRCVRSVEAFLLEIPELTSWEVDLNHPKKIITVNGAEGLSALQLIKAIDEAGYESKEVIPSED